MAGRPKRRERQQAEQNGEPRFANEAVYAHERPSRPELADLDFENRGIGHPISDPVLEKYRLGADTAAKRALAAVRMNAAFYSYADIAWHLGYRDAKEAQRDIIRALAEGVGEEDKEHIRAKVKAAAETQLRRSLALAGATEIELEDGTHVRNVEQRAWHAEARNDLKLYAELQGVAGDKKISVDITNSDMAEMIGELAAALGHEGYEADPLELTQLPDQPDGAYEVRDGDA